jgi:3-hexulose-6-phosphate synthase
MKLQIAFDQTDLEQALACADQVQQYTDIFEVGSLLIYKYGEHAVVAFKERFPERIILADVKLVERAKETIALFADAGADWITVMAGTNRNIIYTATQQAHELGKRVMLDLFDASSLGQSALDAKNLGADALLFHQPFKENAQLPLAEQWDMVKGNTAVPVFVAFHGPQELIVKELQTVKPAGIVLGSMVTQAENPQQMAAYFYELAHGSEA